MMRPTSAWLARAAAVLFAVSFVLPAADLGPAGRPPAIGAMAVFLAAFVLPLSVRMLVDAPASRPGSVGDTLFALTTGVYFALLVVQNGVMLYGWFARGRQYGSRARALVRIAAILPWGAPLVDYGRIYRALGLAHADAFALRPGFYVWALSFLLLALAVRTGAEVREPPGAGG